MMSVKVERYSHAAFCQRSSRGLAEPGAGMAGMESSDRIRGTRRAVFSAPRAQAQSADPTTNICVNIERCARTTQTHWRPMPFEMPHALGRSEEYQKWPPSLRVDAMMPDTEKT